MSSQCIRTQVLVFFEYCLIFYKHFSRKEDSCAGLLFFVFLSFKKLFFFFQNFFLSRQNPVFGRNIGWKLKVSKENVTLKLCEVIREYLGKKCSGHRATKRDNSPEQITIWKNLKTVQYKHDWSGDGRQEIYRKWSYRKEEKG